MKYEIYIVMNAPAVYKGERKPDILTNEEPILKDGFFKITDIDCDIFYVNATNVKELKIFTKVKN